MSKIIKDNLWQVGGSGLTDPGMPPSISCVSATKRRSSMPDADKVIHG